jgi:hypothetical protein
MDLPLELGQEEVDVNTRNDRKCHPDETNLAAETSILWVLDIRRDKSDGETDTKTGPGSNGECLFSERVRRDFSSDSPALLADRNAMRQGTYHGMGDHVLAKTAVQRKRDATRRLA